MRPPLTILLSTRDNGTIKEKYLAKPSDAEVSTSGACIMVCHTNKKLASLPQCFP